MEHLYRHFDKNGVLLYVGISLSALQRLCAHKHSAEWFNSIASVKIENFETREAASAAEIVAIKNEYPLHNIQHNSPLLVEVEATLGPLPEMTILKGCKPVIEDWLDKGGDGSFSSFVEFSMRC